jgi:hypothetical protein
MWLCYQNVTCSLFSSILTTTMAEYDLSKTIIPYLDRHLSFPLLAHLSEIFIFPLEEVQVAQYELAKGTNMFDYAVSLFEQIYPGEKTPAGELYFVLKKLSNLHCFPRHRI